MICIKLYFKNELYITGINILFLNDFSLKKFDI